MFLCMKRVICSFCLATLYYLCFWAYTYVYIYDQVLGFSEYIEEVYAAYEQHRIETMVILQYIYYGICPMN